ncbi:uncharacterized protein LOC134178556 [Corticium candelabrum]|uniref:uncharacterized protein LOC134178556 n=1 Tax=Corticium candelabrum TaxID=121492 RepID=UPI002E274813|nr:uncharacterized protein LOC134178556 [Corticium candelabrum]
MAEEYLNKISKKSKNEHGRNNEAGFRDRWRKQLSALLTTFVNLYSYLNPFEFTDEDVELQFFKGNPSLGKYYNWIIVGDVVDPDWFSEAIRKEMAVYLNDWQLDHLPERVDLLRKLLHSNLSLPNVIYTHCEAGTDRTGEVSGAYYMRYLNMTFEQALSIDNHVQNRSIAKMSLRGLKWYCYYLQYDKDYNVNCTVPSYILSAGFNSIKT